MATDSILWRSIDCLFFAFGIIAHSQGDDTTSSRRYHCRRYRRRRRRRRAVAVAVAVAVTVGTIGTIMLV